MTMVKGFNSCF